MSEHIVVALPIVSQAERTRTRLLSFNIRVVANARAYENKNGPNKYTSTYEIVHKDGITKLTVVTHLV